MKVEVGDRVRFLNEVGGGKVLRILDKRMVLVETDDGFEIPVLAAEVVVINRNADNQIIGEDSLPMPNPPKRAEKYSKESNQKAGSATGLSMQGIAERQGDDILLLLGFVPDNLYSLSSSGLRLYLINDSSYKIFYTLSSWNEGKLNPIISGLLEADSKEQVAYLVNDEARSAKTLNLQAIYFKGMSFKAYQPEFYDVEIASLKLQHVSSYVENDYFDDKACLVTIADTQKEVLLERMDGDSIKKIIREKENQHVKNKPKKSLPVNEIEEVDLHIEELVDSWSNLSPGEILNIQLARFETALQGGIKSNTKRMVFIHGVGNGKLKYEIHKLLDTRFAGLKYQDASFKEYGFGATLVYIK